MNKVKFGLYIVALAAGIAVSLASTVQAQTAKADSYETSLLGLIFNGTAIADLAENDSTSPATSLYLSLHSADVGEAGSQTTNECAYTGYGRAAVTRNSGGFTVAGDTVALASATDFPAATGGTCTATHFAVGTASSGAGVVLYYGSLSPSIAISDGVTPRLGTGTTITED